MKTSHLVPVPSLTNMVRAEVARRFGPDVIMAMLKLHDAGTLTARQIVDGLRGIMAEIFDEQGRPRFDTMGRAVGGRRKGSN